MVGTNREIGATRLGRRAAVVAGILGLTVVVALVALQLRADGPAAIRLAAGGGGGGDLLATAESDSAPARGDLLLWQPVEYRFTLDDGARIDAGEALVWTLEPPVDLEGAANDLAGHFGLTPVAPAPSGEGFVAGDPERSGPTLWVGSAGDWSYHAPDAELLWDCVQPAPLPAPADDAAADADAPDTATSDRPDVGEVDAVEGPEEGTSEGSGPRDQQTPEVVCEPPVPPDGVPSEAEARALAEALFADLALPGDVTIQEVWADDWGAWVQGLTTLAGVSTELPVSAGWGGDATLTSISSTLAEPVDAGLYPTVDAERAVQRLEDLGGGWGGLPGARPLPMPEALDAPMPTEPIDDLPRPDPQAEPEVVTVTLVDVAPVLLPQWDVDGTAWLLPGYRFTDADGGIWQVLAVSDDYLDVSEVDADPDVADPGVSEPSEPEPGGSPEARDLAHRTIGMAEGDAIELAEAAGLAVRVVERDGEALPSTDDLQPDRVNLHVESGIVIDATLG